MTKKKYELLDIKLHQDVHIDTRDFSAEANKTNRVVIVSSEVPTLATEYPIFIGKLGRTDEFFLFVLLGVEESENLFINDKDWAATFIPLDILRRPFHAYLPEGESQQDGAIALDRSSPQVQGTYGERIFDDEGKPTKYLQRVQNIFAELMDRTPATKKQASELNRLGLIESVELSMPTTDGEEAHTLKGLYAINETALRELSGETLQECHQNGLLLLATLIANSRTNLEKLNVMRYKRSLANASTN